MNKTIEEIFRVEGLCDSNSNYDEVFSYLQEVPPKDLDYASLFGLAPIIFFGEGHSSKAAKDEIIQNISRFRTLGITHFATEMLPLSMQSAINRYSRIGDNKDEIFDYHLKEFSRLGESIPQRYMQMIDAAKSAKVEIIALDLDDREESPEIRNKVWARLLANKIHTQRSSKVLVYCGAGHVGYSQYCSKAPNELENNHGVLSRSISIIGDNDHPVSRIVPSYSNPDILLRAIEDFGIKDKRFVIPLKETCSRSGDIYLHLPDSS